MNKTQQIVTASWIAVSGNAILALLKITVGIISGSLAVLGDGIDTFTDIITSLITLFTARIISKQPNKKFSYGYLRADTIAAKVLSFIILFAGFQLAISSIKQVLLHQTNQMPAPIAVYVTILSIFGKYLMSWYLLRKAKKLNSLMLRANGKNMQNDVLISFSVLAGLFFTYILKIPILDSITALVVSFFILKTGFEIFKETNTELMDGISNNEVYTQLFEAIKECKEAYNPHRVRIRRVGEMYVISLDLEVDGTISVYEAHQISRKVEDSIYSNIENVYDIRIHIEPKGNVEEEKYGLDERDCK